MTLPAQVTGDKNEQLRNWSGNQGPPRKKENDTGRTCSKYFCNQQVSCFLVKASQTKTKPAIWQRESFTSALEAEETEAISAGSTIGSDSKSTSNSGDSNHTLNIEVVEDEYFVTINHPMTKDHYISFIAAISNQGIQLTKLYPEGPAQARFKIAGVHKIFAYCNRHGLFELLRKNI